MPSTIIQVDSHHPDPVVIAQAAARLAAGELVAFPTETVYGLGADALNAEAVARIFAAKARPAWNPVIAHVASAAAARALTAAWPDSAKRLADRFWPGPLSLVLPKLAIVPDLVTAGLDVIAVRVPSHPVALALLRAFGGPIAAPSANRFTHVSPTTAQHVLTSLGDRAGLILDGGSCTVGIESTVVDLAGPVPTILRPGMITRAQLEDALQRTVHGPTSASVAPGGDREQTAPHTPQRSPGMAERHYAPTADVWLFDATQADEIRLAIAALPSSERPIIALLCGDTVQFAVPQATVHRLPPNPAAYAQALYAALHAADSVHARLVIIERPPDDDAWTGVRDRLARAAR